MAGLNLLTDPWIPLSGHAGPASFIELLCGEKDAEDIDWPRDDFKVFTRLLLSAIAQALFPAKTVAELKQRIEKPMAKAQVHERLARVVADFELLPEGRPGFLQVKPEGDGAGGAARFAFSNQDLFLSAANSASVSLWVAAVALFAEQTYAGGAGRGYGAGPGGQPGVFTLIDPGSVRSAIWANTIAGDLDTKHKSTSEPWSNAEKPVRLRASIGLADGLFFQPRAIWLEPTQGLCMLTGREGTTVTLAGFGPKHAVGKDKDYIWTHPCSPMVRKSTGVAPVRLPIGQPAWTGLVHLLSPLSRAKSAKKIESGLEGPALVLQQWWKMASSSKRKPRLIVLDYPGRDKAKLKAVLYESFPLTGAVGRTIEPLRLLTQDTEDVLKQLVRALKLAHDDLKRGGFAIADATARFWRGTEDVFLAWLDVMSRDEISDDDSIAIERLTREKIRRSALELFDEHVAVSEWEPRKQSRIARARQALRRELTMARAGELHKEGGKDVA